MRRIADRPTVDRDFAGQNEPLEARAGEPRMKGQRAVEPLAVFGSRDDDRLRTGALRHGRPELEQT